MTDKDLKKDLEKEYEELIQKHWALQNKYKQALLHINQLSQVVNTLSGILYGEM